MTEAARKARLAELELAASNPYADNHTLLAFADALEEEFRRLQMQREAQQPSATREAKQQAPVTREVKMSSNTPSQAEIDERFNSWFRASFKAAIEPYMTFLEEEIGKHIGDLDREIDLLSIDIKNIVVANGGVRNSATGKLKLQKLDDVIIKLRAEMRREITTKFRALRADLQTQGASNITTLSSQRKS